MKRRDLIRRLQEAGFSLLRSKGPHDVYGRGTQRIPVPRHREIKEYLARKILRDAGAE
jgi:mRNA interferase HicA